MVIDLSTIFYWLIHMLYTFTEIIRESDIPKPIYWLTSSNLYVIWVLVS